MKSTRNLQTLNCPEAQNQPKSQILLDKNSSPSNFYIVTLFTIKISHTTCATTVYVVHTVYIVCTLYIAVVAMPVRPATTPFCSPNFFLRVILCKKVHRQAS